MTLHDFLKLSGETQVRFADRLGVTPPYVSLLIARKREPSDQMKQKIAAATGGAVPTDEWETLEERPQ